MPAATHHTPKNTIGNRTQAARSGPGFFGGNCGTGYRAGAAAAAPAVGGETAPILLPPHLRQNGASFPVSIPHWLQNMAVPREASFVRSIGEGNVTGVTPNSRPCARLQCKVGIYIGWGNQKRLLQFRQAE